MWTYHGHPDAPDGMCLRGCGATKPYRNPTFLPGQTVYIELPLPRVDSASAARVKWVSPKRVFLEMGAMSGWYPKAEVGKTAEEAEQIRETIDRARLGLPPRQVQVS